VDGRSVNREKLTKITFCARCPSLQKRAEPGPAYDYKAKVKNAPVRI